MVIWQVHMSWARRTAVRKEGAVTGRVGEGNTDLVAK